MIPGGTTGRPARNRIRLAGPVVRRTVPYRRCPSCRCNVAQLPHVEGSEDCRLAGEERLASMDDDHE